MSSPFVRAQPAQECMVTPLVHVYFSLDSVGLVFKLISYKSTSAAKQFISPSLNDLLFLSIGLGDDYGHPHLIDQSQSELSV